MLEKGWIFDNKYEILEVLGSGGMGTVYLAKNVRLDSLWAIKEAHKEKGKKINLLAEPNILKRLNHPSLPRIFDIIEGENHIYIILDYIEGTTLKELLEKQGRFPEETVTDWAKQICEILDYLHSQKPNPIIYRDMKPSNLMLSNDGKITLIDFGIAREHKENSSQDTTYIGTKGFAAPEQYGLSQTDERTDIYGLGMTLYNLLTGKSPNEPPYEIIPVRSLSKKYSKGIEHIIEKCTQQNPQKRYKTISHLVGDLNNIDKIVDKNRKNIKPNIFKTAVIVLTVLFGVLAFIGWTKMNALSDKNLFVAIKNPGGFWQDSNPYIGILGIIGLVIFLAVLMSKKVTGVITKIKRNAKRNVDGLFYEENRLDNEEDNIANKESSIANKGDSNDNIKAKSVFSAMDSDLEKELKDIKNKLNKNEPDKTTADNAVEDTVLLDENERP